MNNPVFPAGPHVLPTPLPPLPKDLGAQTSLSQTPDSERVSWRAPWSRWLQCPPVMEEQEENHPSSKEDEQQPPALPTLHKTAQQLQGWPSTPVPTEPRVACMFTVLARNSKSLLSTGPMRDLKQSVSSPLTLNPHLSKEEDRASRWQHPLQL